MPKLKQSILTIVIGLALAAGISYAWTGPTANPPLSNAPAPINVGALSQIKEGALQVNGFKNIGNSIFDGSMSIGGLFQAYGTAIFDGRVGIGTMLPGAKLHALATTEQLRLGHNASNYWSGTVGSTGGLTLAGTGTGGALSLTPTSGQNLNVNLSTTGDFAVNTNQLYVDTSTGYVGIGTLAPGAKLDVNGDVQATSFLYSSDRRLKKDITSLSDDVVENILRLQGVSFMWEKDGRKDIGLIAQDVEKIYPDLVATGEYTGYKSIQYAGLIAPLIELVKKQQERIDALEMRIERLDEN